jgi:hypothetical protein
VIALIVLGLIFFALYEQTYGSWVLFSDRVMNHRALGVEWTASELTSLGAFFILILAPFFAWLYPRLDARGINPSTPAKSAYGLVLAGVAFLVLVWSGRHRTRTDSRTSGGSCSPISCSRSARCCFADRAFRRDGLSVPSVVSPMMGAGSSALPIRKSRGRARETRRSRFRKARRSISSMRLRSTMRCSSTGEDRIVCGIVVLVLTPLINADARRALSASRLRRVPSFCPSLKRVREKRITLGGKRPGCAGA